LILEDLAREQPNTVRDKDHLLQLLRAGMSSPTHPVTEDTWDYIRAEVQKRHALRQSASHDPRYLNSDSLPPLLDVRRNLIWRQEQEAAIPICGVWQPCVRIGEITREVIQIRIVTIKAQHAHGISEEQGM
jgi:hypothetical protein